MHGNRQRRVRRLRSINTRRPLDSIQEILDEDHASPSYRIIVVLLAAFTVSGVFAQGMRGPGPGPGGPDGPGGPLVMLLLNSTLHASLALDSAHEAAWTALQTAHNTMRTQGDAARLDFQAYVAGQFASGAPTWWPSNRQGSRSTRRWRAPPTPCGCRRSRSTTASRRARRSARGQCRGRALPADAAALTSSSAGDDGGPNRRTLLGPSGL